VLLTADPGGLAATRASVAVWSKSWTSPLTRSPPTTSCAMDASTSRNANKSGTTFDLEGELTTPGALRQHMLQSSGAAATQREHPEVLVTALLDIHPPECDRRFWHSATWQQSVRGLDCCYVGFVATNNCVLHVYRKRWPGENVPFLEGTVSLFLLLSLLQSYGAYHSTPLYHRARPMLVAVNRCASWRMHGRCRRQDIATTNARDPDVP
jgi:hypothetical protein